jgi:hypothetical protein
MNSTLILAVPAALLALVGGGIAAPPAALPAAPAPAAAPGDGDWATVKSEEGIYEFQAPPGFSEKPPTKSGVIRQIQYTGEPYANSLIKVHGLKGYTRPEHLDVFMKAMEKSIGGNIAYVGDSKTRFTTDLQAGNEWWVSQIQGQIESGWGYAIECLVQKKVYDKTKDVWMKVADSFKALPPPPETFAVPTGWKAKKNSMYAAIGPVGEIQDKQARDKLDGFLDRVLLWLDPDRSERPFPKMFRAFLEDDRKFMHRLPVRVLPTAEAFKAAAGGRWFEGAVVLYLPEDPDKVLLVNGAPDSPIQEKDMVGEAGVQYVETRLGRLWPWLRAAIALYYDAGYRKGCTTGLFPPEMLKRGKEVFGKSPAPFDDLMKKDDAGMKALGEDGRVAAWGCLQCGLHGGDAGYRGLFRGLLKDGIDQPDLGPVWEKLLVKFKKDNKKNFNTRDFDSAVKKYFKDLKEDKK